MELVKPEKINPGTKVAVLSPSLAGPAFGPEIHEQAMRRLREELKIEPVVYPTTCRQNSSAEEKATDLNVAFADPEIGAIMATIGGYNLIEVLPHLDFSLIKANPKIFLGYSDNTNLHNYFFHAGFKSFYGGSTMVHIGAGPAIDAEHLQGLRRVLFDGGWEKLSIPSEYEDCGRPWEEKTALSEYGERIPTPDPLWAGPSRKIQAVTWGGCLEVLDQLALADLLPENHQLTGKILLLENSNPQIADEQLLKWVRGLGERGLLECVGAVMYGQSRTIDLGYTLPAVERYQIMVKRNELIVEIVSKYNPNIPICCGYPFGHTRPQLILPHGGEIIVDGCAKAIWADYS